MTGSGRRVRPGRRRTVLLLVSVAVLGMTTGCAGSTRPAAHPTRTTSSYWDRARLLDARPIVPDDRDLPTPSASATAHPAQGLGALRVGALFVHNSSGNHFCTASVVASPGGNVLITAAHCLNQGKETHAYNQDIVFIPGYRDGQEPFGVWSPAKLVVAPQWIASSDPDLDVGFVVLEPRNGENIQQVLGANRIGIDVAGRYRVHVTGYPASSDAPISCVNTTSVHSDTQLRFDCAGYTGGTSGSPWVTNYDTSTHSGTIVGVVGGYQEGGDTDSVSYSVRFGQAVVDLYHQAVREAAGSRARPGLPGQAMSPPVFQTSMHGVP